MLRIDYTITSGAFPVTVELTGGITLSNIHYSPESGYFDNVPEGDYEITFTDSDNCVASEQLQWCDCPEGYSQTGTNCVKYDELEATYTATTYTILKKASDNAYSVYGLLIFDTWNYNGTGIFEWINDLNTYWRNAPYPSVTGVMNRTCVWGSTTANNQDIGFSFCINIAATKIYYIGFGCDNWGKIKLNGQFILEQDLTAIKAMFASLGNMSGYNDDGATFKYWYIYPITLTAGQNIIEVFGHNRENVAAVGIQIYDATKQDIIDATNTNPLGSKILFTSESLVGETLQYEYSLGGGFHGYSCPEGYALDTCGEIVKCVKKIELDCGELPTPETTTTSTSYSGTTTTTTTGEGTTTTTTTEVPETTTTSTTEAEQTTTTSTTDTGTTTTTTTMVIPEDSIDVTCVTSSNALTYQTTPTYDGSGQAVHPDVYYNPYGWNGYKYWMAMTPYPSGNDNYENPSIIVSNDGDTWSVPGGLTNPISPMPVGGHLADVDIFIGYDGLMYVLYVKVVGTSTTAHYKYSSDGISWSTEQTISQTTADKIGSPAIIMENNEYVMYYVAASEEPNELRKITCATMSGTWSAATTCTLNNMPSGRRAWHIDVTKYGSEYHGLLVTSTDDGGSGSILYFAISTNATTWNISSNILINKSVSGWDNSLVYRGTMILMYDGDFYYDCWYSARSSGGVWHIGRTTISLCTLTTTTSTTGVPTTTTTTTTQSVTLTTNLLAVWELDETSGTNIEDAHSTFDGTVSGATINQAGILNRAVSFDGTADYISMGNVLNFERTDSFSISCWMKTSNTSFRVLVGKMLNVSPYTGYILSINSGKLQFQLISTFTPSNYLIRETTSTYNNNAWRHIVVTYPGTSNPADVIIYIDGSPVAATSTQNTLSASISNTANFSIGARNNAGGIFIGTIDQTAIWNKVLNQSEVTSLYNSGNGLAYTSWT